METKGDGCRCRARHLCRGVVPVVAHCAASGCLVFECRYDGSIGGILCYGNIPTYSVLCHCVCGPSWSLAFPELVRGCWVL